MSTNKPKTPSDEETPKWAIDIENAIRSRPILGGYGEMAKIIAKHPPDESAELAKCRDAISAAIDVMQRALPTIDSRITDYADEFRAAIAQLRAAGVPQ